MEAATVEAKVTVSRLIRTSAETMEPTLTVINKCVSGLNPTSISCDFEQAIIKSNKTNYPNTEIKNCLYHLTKNVYQQICDLAIVTQ